MDQPSRHPPPVHSVIIDTDPGIDDVVTLALAACTPEVEIVAVTTTYGNAPLDLCTRNAREILRLAGRPEIPVRPGSATPLVRALVTAPETHGPEGVGYAPVPDKRNGDGDVNQHVLLDVLSMVPEPVTLLTLGPLTNLAHALTADPELVRSRVKRHIGMFGNLRERGNTNRWADFNAWSDPEATDLVLRGGLQTLMVGLDVTRRLVITAREVDRLASAGHTLIHWLGRALVFYVEFHRRAERLDGCVVNDPLTLGELIDPGLLTAVNVPVEIDLDQGEHRGHTKEHENGVPTAVAMDVDVPRMRILLDRVFGSGWQDPRVEGTT